MITGLATRAADMIRGQFMVQRTAFAVAHPEALRKQESEASE
jgi:hypothetical protein